MNLTTVLVVIFVAVAVSAAGDGKTTTSSTKQQQSTAASQETSPVVNTNNGAVRGRIIRAANGRYAQEFLNIPFAQPPVGALRFRAPQPVSNWSGERDGAKLGNACVQVTGELSKVFKNAKIQFEADPTTLSEDCLTVNVHTPYPTSGGNGQKGSSLLPVLVWIHGGGFQMGGNNLKIYNASILASEINAIVVTINYRLGAFGFFTLDGVEGVTGNQGLLDQALAIKWVRDNAKHFGGDPEQITLFGESAGGASVHYQILSPMSRDNFARGIMQSGTAVSFWAYQTPQQAQQSSRAFAAFVGCGNGSGQTSDEEVFRCFTSKSVEELLAANEKIKEAIKMMLVPTSDGVFLTKSPADMIKAGDFKHAPAMIGTTANESMSLLSMTYSDLLSKLPNVQLSQAAFDDMLLQMTFFLGNASRDAIKFMYRNWAVSSDDEKQLSSERWRILNAVMDDLFMTNGMIETLDAYAAAKVPIYRYRLDQISKANLLGYNFNAAVHGDDVPYFLGLPLDPEFGYPKEEADLSRHILHAISGFARTGNPNLHSVGERAANKPKETDAWKSYAGNMEYFTFDTANYGKVQVAPERWRLEFWHRAVPYLSKLEAQAGVNAARAAAARKPTLTEKDPNEVEPKTEL